MWFQTVSRFVRNGTTASTFVFVDAFRSSSLNASQVGMNAGHDAVLICLIDLNVSLGVSWNSARYSLAKWLMLEKPVA